MLTTDITIGPRPIFPSRAILGEGPCWDESRGVLWWVDIEAFHLHCFDPATHDDRVFNIGQRVSLVVPRRNGDLLLGLHHGLASFDPDRESLTVLCDPEADLPQNRFNDGKCDQVGRLWAGTMNLDPMRHQTGSLYSLEPTLRVQKHLPDVGVSNGLAWSADAKTLYFIDTMVGTIDAFDFDIVAGCMSNRRVVFRVPTELGGADGMTIDVDGNLWVAFWGGWCVAHIDPRLGTILRQIMLPVSNVTSCAFGGEHLDDLYITTARLGLGDTELESQPHAGDLFVVQPGVAGMPQPVFAD